MSIEAITFAKMVDLGESSFALHLLLRTIAEHQYNDSRVCRVTQEQLAIECGRASVRSVRRWLDDLEARRVIIRRRRRSDGGHVLQDEIRIVGFTRWYRSQRPVVATRRRSSPPDNVSGGEPDVTTGQSVRQPPDSRSPVATGQQESGTYKALPTLLPTLPPQSPPDGGQPGEGEGKRQLRFASGWDDEARREVSLAAYRSPVVANAFLVRVCAVLPPPKVGVPAAIVGEMVRSLSQFAEATLTQLADAVIEGRKACLPSIADLVAQAEAIAADAGRPEPIAAGDPRWPALIAWLTANTPNMVPHAEKAGRWIVPQGVVL